MQCMTGSLTSAKHGNLFIDNNIIYSYGYHYPLAIKINGSWFINDAGYSTTTAKHISIAKHYGNYAFAYRSKNNYMTDEAWIMAINDNINYEISIINENIKKITRRGIKKLAKLQSRLNILNNGLCFLHSL